MTHTATAPAIDDSLRRIIDARHHDPFEVLGRHTDDDRALIRVFGAGVTRVHVEADRELERVGDTDIFEWRGDPAGLPARYRVTRHYADRPPETRFDPYCFPPQLGDFDLHVFGEGGHWHAYRMLGARAHTADGVSGVLFATWAPNAERISVVGDFNDWDGRLHPMRVRGGSGVWELFIPDLEAGARYKFEIRPRDTGAVMLKTDPYGRAFEERPRTASLVEGPGTHAWEDGAWMEARAGVDWLHRPMSIYEVHLGSWRRSPGGGFLSYRELADVLAPYVADMGFTHVELLPVTEHPLDASWGYQTTGYFAPTSRFGTPDDFRYLIDAFHRHGLGVLLDWAPGHFPRDEHAIARFDGSALYEHADPRLGEHQDWGTLIFNYGRNEVRNFLLSNAVYWLEEFHVDGLRVDAVASMLYLDYSRAEGEWLPNRYGGNENLEAIDFLRRLNQVVHERFPGALVIAEESTAWPQVTRPTWVGGLGFSMKWNMGWMHDTLEYLSKDPVHRVYHHDNLTFGLLYAFTENFVLPFSHDEVVHGKGSLMGRMPGDDWQQFANLRLLYAYMWTYPGKKLLFMGCEFGQRSEWNHDGELEWFVLEHDTHRGVQALLRDLNRLYRDTQALNGHDFDAEGFEWIDCHDAPQSVISYVRRAGDDVVVVALNFTPVPRHGYRIGVPEPGRYRELLNTDSSFYGGGNLGNGDGAEAEETPWMGRPYSMTITLPPLAAVVFQPEHHRS